MRLSLATIVLLVLVPVCGHADGPPRIAFDVSLYPYLDRVDNDTDLTLTTNARLPGRFSYFSFINFNGVASSGEASFLRSEQTLRWSLSDSLPLDLSAQAILVDGPGNDITQFGISWRVDDTPGLARLFEKINTIYRVTFQLARFTSGNDSAWQMEHFFKMRFPNFSDRLYLSGFVDQTFDLNLPEQFPDNPVVSEIQAGARLWRDFYVIGEYRINRFRKGNEYNFAAGIEYKLEWR